jgi:hypothetical protein
MVSCHQDTAPLADHRPHPALKRYEQRVHIHTMNELMVMVSFQHWVGSADDDINLFLVGGKNCSWQLHEGHNGRFALWALKLAPSLHHCLHQDTISTILESLIKGFQLV